MRNKLNLKFYTFYLLIYNFYLLISYKFIVVIFIILNYTHKNTHGNARGQLTSIICTEWGIQNQQHFPVFRAMLHPKTSIGRTSSASRLTFPLPALKLGRPWWWRNSSSEAASPKSTLFLRMRNGTYSSSSSERLAWSFFLEPRGLQCPPTLRTCGTL